MSLYLQIFAHIVVYSNEHELNQKINCLKKQLLKFSKKFQILTQSLLFNDKTSENTLGHSIFPLSAFLSICTIKNGI